MKGEGKKKKKEKKKKKKGEEKRRKEGGKRKLYWMGEVKIPRPKAYISVWTGE